jgi:uncharacterized protein (DUF1684 family)
MQCLFRFLIWCLFLACLPTASTAQTPYLQELAEHRRYLDSVYRYTDASPLKASDRANFKGLAYFAPDTAFRVQASYKAIPKKRIKIKVTHQSKPRWFVRVGELVFTLQGKEYKLFAYQDERAHRKPPRIFFVPFYDETSGKETYGGGRYLDIFAPKDTVILDFNYAYAPYCAHNDQYACPIPPKENRLKVKILAGERQ